MSSWWWLASSGVDPNKMFIFLLQIYFLQYGTPPASWGTCACPRSTTGAWRRAGESVKKGGSLTSCGNVTSVRWWVSLVVGKLQELDEVPLTTIAPSKEMCDYKCARFFGGSFFVWPLLLFSKPSWYFLGGRSSDRSRVTTLNCFWRSCWKTHFRWKKKGLGRNCMPTLAHFVTVWI